MATSKLNMKWDSFASHLTTWMTDLYLYEEKSSDVTIICGDRKKLRAHSFVLKACSPIFQTILEDSNTVFFRGVHYEAMKSLIQFMYLGQTAVDDEKLPEFFELAQELQVKELGDNNDLSKSVNHENIRNNQKRDNTKDAIDKEVSGKAIDHEAGRQIEDSNEAQIEEPAQIGIKNENSEFDVFSCSVAFDTEDIITDADHMFEQDFEHEQSLLRNHEEESINSAENFEQNFLQFPTKYEQTKEERKYPCGECDYEALRAGNLKLHVQAIHRGIKYKCDKCDKYYSRKDYLSNHIKSRH